jgi:hypothetical protein
MYASKDVCVGLAGELGGLALANCTCRLAAKVPTCTAPVADRPFRYREKAPDLCIVEPLLDELENRLSLGSRSHPSTRADVFVAGRRNLDSR